MNFDNASLNRIHQPSHTFCGGGSFVVFLIEFLGEQRFFISSSCVSLAYLLFLTSRCGIVTECSYVDEWAPYCPNFTSNRHFKIKVAPTEKPSTIRATLTTRDGVFVFIE